MGTLFIQDTTKYLVAQVSKQGVPVSIAGTSAWGLWWKKRQWDRVFFEYFGFSIVNLIPPKVRVHSLSQTILIL